MLTASMVRNQSAKNMRIMIAAYRAAPELVNGTRGHGRDELQSTALREEIQREGDEGEEENDPSDGHDGEGKR